MSMREDLTFESGGETCAAWLYRPAGDGDAPCVVMAHGFTATREEALPGYAEAFAQAGFAALVFDYRYFGDSTGSPRQLLDIKAQRADYVAAVDFARGLDGIDAERIVLWGSSFSGGHVMWLAQRDARVKAVIAQAPFTNGLSIVKTAPKKNLLRATFDGVRDEVASLRGRPPVLIPAVAPPGQYAAMSAPEADSGFRSIVPPNSKWQNLFTARVMLRLGLERPDAGVGKLQMPLLICACSKDQTTPPGPAAKAAERAPKGELKIYPLGHFEIYSHDQAKADQVEFLTRHLPGTKAPASAAEPAASL